MFLILLKEMKDNSRKQINELTATIKQIEKHKLELINGFKKQMQLIENLKKQKVCLVTKQIIKRAYLYTAGMFLYMMLILAMHNPTISLLQRERACLTFSSQ